jgi:hypothetical protein
MDFHSLIEAINFRGVVSGLTHDFYRYPARFSPLFARVAIELFTKPGDTVLDPFAGGCTSVVEALAAGRHAVGADISPLAVFLGKAKTLLVGQRDLDLILDWAIDVVPDLSPRKPVERHWEWKEAGYQDNLPWRFRKVAEQAINGAEDLPPRLRPAARCIVLKTVQWAVDCKKRLPTAQDFRERLIEHAVAAANGLKACTAQVASVGANRPLSRRTTASRTRLLSCRRNRRLKQRRDWSRVILCHWGGLADEDYILANDWWNQRGLLKLSFRPSDSSRRRNDQRDPAAMAHDRI